MWQAKLFVSFDLGIAWNANKHFSRHLINVTINFTTKILINKQVIICLVTKVVSVLFLS